MVLRPGREAGVEKGPQPGGPGTLVVGFYVVPHHDRPVALDP